MPYSVSVIMPALNEEANLDLAVQSVFEAAKDTGCEANILIVNDGSSDSTGVIADQLSAEDPRVRVCHNMFTRGLGTAFITGLVLCEGDYFGYVPADNQIDTAYLRELFKHLGEADLILSYPANMEVRHRHRQVISRLFTRIYNFLFRLKITYYNGPAFFRHKLVREMDFPTRFFSYHAETVIRFLKHGHSYIEVPCTLQERQHGKSTALKPHNFIGIMLSTLFVFVDVYIISRVQRDLRRMKDTKDQAQK